MLFTLLLFVVYDDYPKFVAELLITISLVANSSNGGNLCWLLSPLLLSIDPLMLLESFDKFILFQVAVSNNHHVLETLCTVVRLRLFCAAATILLLLLLFYYYY